MGGENIRIREVLPLLVLLIVINVVYSEEYQEVWKFNILNVTKLVITNTRTYTEFVYSVYYSCIGESESCDHKVTLEISGKTITVSSSDTILKVDVSGIGFTYRVLSSDDYVTFDTTELDILSCGSSNACEGCDFCIAKVSTDIEESPNLKVRVENVGYVPLGSLHIDVSGSYSGICFSSFSGIDAIFTTKEWIDMVYENSKFAIVSDSKISCSSAYTKYWADTCVICSDNRKKAVSPTASSFICSTESYSGDYEKYFGSSPEEDGWVVRESDTRIYWELILNNTKSILPIFDLVGSKIKFSCSNGRVYMGIEYISSTSAPYVLKATPYSNELFLERYGDVTAVCYSESTGRDILDGNCNPDSVGVDIGDCEDAYSLGRLLAEENAYGIRRLVLRYKDGDAYYNNFTDALSRAEDFVTKAESTISSEGGAIGGDLHTTFEDFIDNMLNDTVVVAPLLSTHITTVSCGCPDYLYESSVHVVSEEGIERSSDYYWCSPWKNTILTVESIYGDYPKYITAEILKVLFSDRSYSVLLRDRMWYYNNETDEFVDVPELALCREDTDCASGRCVPALDKDRGVIVKVCAPESYSIGCLSVEGFDEGRGIYTSYSIASIGETVSVTIEKENDQVISLSYKCTDSGWIFVGGTTIMECPEDKMTVEGCCIGSARVVAINSPCVGEYSEEKHCCPSNAPYYSTEGCAPENSIDICFVREDEKVHVYIAKSGRWWDCYDIEDPICKSVMDFLSRKYLFIVYNKRENIDWSNILNYSPRYISNGGEWIVTLPRKSARRYGWDVIQGIVYMGPLASPEIRVNYSMIVDGKRIQAVNVSARGEIVDKSITDVPYSGQYIYALSGRDRTDNYPPGMYILTSESSENLNIYNISLQYNGSSNISAEGYTVVDPSRYITELICNVWREDSYRNVNVLTTLVKGFGLYSARITYSMLEVLHAIFKEQIPLKVSAQSGTVLELATCGNGIREPWESPITCPLDFLGGG